MHDIIQCSIDRYEAHRDVERAVRDKGISPIAEERHYLWRMISELGNNFAVIRSVPQVLSQDVEGATFEFGLDAVPVKTLGQNNNRKKRFKPILEREAQLEWLRSRLAARGMELISIKSVETRREPINARRYAPFWVYPTNFIGTLRVIDYEKTTDALNNGVGGHRIYGFGMLIMEKHHG